MFSETSVTPLVVRDLISESLTCTALHPSVRNVSCNQYLPRPSAFSIQVSAQKSQRFHSGFSGVQRAVPTVAKTSVLLSIEYSFLRFYFEQRSTRRLYIERRKVTIVPPCPSVTRQPVQVGLCRVSALLCAPRAHGWLHLPPLRPSQTGRRVLRPSSHDAHFNATSACLSSQRLRPCRAPCPWTRHSRGTCVRQWRP